MSIDTELYVSLAEVEHALDESSRRFCGVGDATIRDVRRRIRDAAVGTAEALCPCHGSGVVVEVLTPGRDTRDPEYRDREWGCPGPGCLVVPEAPVDPSETTPATDEELVF